MPIETKGQKARRLVAGVKDQASFEAACAAMQDLPNIDDRGPTSGKTALNFAVERFLTSINDTKGPEIVGIAKWKLHMLEVLLEHEADISVLAHPETVALKNTAEQYFNKIFAKLTRNMTGANESISSKELNFAFAHHLFTDMFEIHARANMVRGIYYANPITEGEISSKPIIMCESHDDLGTTEFLTGLEKKLIAADYKCICLEQPFETNIASIIGKRDELIKNGKAIDDHASLPLNKKFMFVMRPEFKSRTRCIDPRLDYADDQIKGLLDDSARKMICPTVSLALRDRGLLYSLLLAVKQYQGRVIGIIGSNHGHRVVTGLRRYKVGCIPIFAMVNPDVNGLCRAANGVLVTKTDCDPGQKILYGDLGVQPLDMRADVKDGVLREFANNYLPAINEKSRPRNSFS